VGFKQGEKETIRKVFAEIDAIAQRKVNEGMNKRNFSLGVLDTIGLTYLYGHYPQHFWLVFMLQSAVMIPLKFRMMWKAKPLNQALYYLDFCWMMNFLGVIFLFLLVMLSYFPSIDVNGAARKAVFSALVGVGAGGITGANIVLDFIALVFHDINSMTGVFIHVMPAIVLYTFLWHGDDIAEAWPDVFDLSYIGSLTYFEGGWNGSVFGCSVILYLTWWTFYVSFMLLIGLDLPKKKTIDGVTQSEPRWDTVFHSTMRGGACVALGRTFRGRSREESLRQMEENSFDLTDFGIYMGMHAVGAVMATALIGYGCFTNQIFHRLTIVLVVVLGVVRGAKRYTYYATMMYSRALQKEFESVLKN